MTLNINFFLGKTTSKPSNTLTHFSSVSHTTTAVEFIPTIDTSFEKEKKVLGRTVKQLLIETGQVSNKAIIISLVKQLEISQESKKTHILRSALEIIVGITPDDIF
ncbi:biofilm development regulator YmgB/AriR family protein [Rosenbergiella australiborealis]|uniref:biofilm development regulator YmgB/AriR family protein n=1 Tax=Rosenbergiella australiborealis TaxID=1544696 RepID=UPI001F4EA6DC|nr:biofilm development regulator YmgB/AriR family protein [Rosenbergiella australiborealis]